MDKLTILHARTPFVLNKVIADSPHYMGAPFDKYGANVRLRPPWSPLGTTPPELLFCSLGQAPEA